MTDTALTVGHVLFSQVFLHFITVLGKCHVLIEVEMGRVLRFFKQTNRE